MCRTATFHNNQSITVPGSLMFVCRHKRTCKRYGAGNVGQQMAAMKHCQAVCCAGATVNIFVKTFADCSTCSWFILFYSIQIPTYSFVNETLCNGYKEGLLAHILRLRTKHSQYFYSAVFMLHVALFKFLAIDFPSTLAQFMKVSLISQIAVL
jgi:hypothetical protein